LQVWGELKKRYYQEKNDGQRGVAVLSAIVLNALASFGKDKSDPVKPNEFLPFDLQENKEYLIDNYTCFLIKKLEKEGKIPPPILRALYANQQLYNAIIDQ
jgi:hypothetical protein